MKVNPTDPRHWQAPFRVLLAAATLWPIAAALLVLVLAVLWLLTYDVQRVSDGAFSTVVLTRPSAGIAALLDSLLLPVIVFFEIGLLLAIGLAVFYVADVLENTTMPGRRKALWVVAFLVAGIVAMPLYWRRHVLR